MTERWRPVPGYEGEYEVSDLGRVRSLARRVRLVTRKGEETTRSVPERILKPGQQSKYGHVSVAIGKGNSRLVHQLVLEAFVGPRPSGQEGLHRNGKGFDNRLTNLRYGTRSENNIDVFYTTGRRLNREQVLYLRERAAAGFYYGERYQLALSWDVNSGTIHHAVSGKNYRPCQVTLYILTLETFCAVPITYGSHRYAEDAEIMLAALAWGDDEPIVLDFTEHDWRDVLQDEIDAADRVMIHNSSFDRTVLRHAGYELPVEKVHDTMVTALQHSLPGKLEQLCEALGLDQDKAKDKDGRKLIQLFCKPRPANHKLDRATRLTHPEDWERFKAYAGRDIIAMRECYRRTPRWNLSRSERELWLLDQRVNDRGIAVDKEHAACAYTAFHKEKARLNLRASLLTHGGVPSLGQNAKFIDYLDEAYDYTLPNVQKGTISALLKTDGLEPEVRELLSLRQMAAATSPAKYNVVANAASADGRLRGLIQFCGAGRTGRDAGRVFQPQNLPRPSLSQLAVEQGVEALKLGCADLMFENVAELCISAVRGCLVAEEGKKLAVADLSNIEGRVLAWGAGEDWKLKAFADYDAGIGHDLYVVAAGRILNVPPEAVTKLQRQNQGKVSELACGYQGAVGAFNSMGKNYGVVLAEDEVLGIVRGWRRAHPNIVSFWYAMDDAAKAAIRNPGCVYYNVNGVAAFDVREGYLRMELPSGRFLSYKHARIDSGNTCHTCIGKGTLLVGGFAPGADPASLVICDDCYGSGRIAGTGQIVFEGLNQYTRQWCGLSTYGGKLVENWTQATARDIFMGGLKRAEAASYPVCMRVHDELIAEVPDEPRWNAKELSALMAQGESWTLGLPMAAAGHEMKRYCKFD